ncbi:imm11 family protein [Burkholderia dolosa]|uniref:imm11 family protein n=1 Tax=Burkholderia dolosa TaxID=152500 RepID=UPI001B8FB34C|nr:DUF1629 domain-containing protein [Burkholderia dolosa]MBR8061019.1 hypothetical protein [Burkholderia dolosa]
MNRIYCLRQGDTYQALVQVDESGEIPYDKSIAIQATALCGQEFGSKYNVVKLSWGTPRKKKDSDVQTLLSPFVMFSSKALEVLDLLLKSNGEILPIDSPVQGFHGFHVTNVLDDAVDLEASKFKVYPTATVFAKIVLLESRVQGANIFRLKEKPSTVFVSEAFRKLVEDNKLKGFDFDETISLSPEK